MIDTYVWKSHPGPKFCRVGNPNGVEDDWELTQGVARADSFPSDAFFAMDKDLPKQVALPDSVKTNDGLVLVSPKLKEFVEARNPSQVEYLQVAIKNHRRQVASPNYFIINPLTIVDCIDKQRSNVIWNDIKPELIAGVLELVLKDVVEIDPSVLLFRPKHLENLVMTTAPFAADITKAGFTGIRFVPSKGFQGS